MKNKARTMVVAAAIALMAPTLTGSLPEANANPSNTAPLIDKDFETALRKFASKRFFARIDASNEQKEKLTNIFASTQDSTRPDREKLRQEILELSDLMANDTVKDEEIVQKVKELRATKEQIMNQRIAAVLEVRKILSANQKEKIHGRVRELITGGLQANKLGFLLNTRAVSLLTDN